MALTVTATPNLESRPPSVLVTVTSSEAETAVVVRENADGTQTQVRTADGLPLVLVGGGSTFTANLVDVEVPYGQLVSYLVEGGRSEPVTVEAEGAWLVHVGQPSLSMPLDLRAGSFSTTSRATARGVFYPLGRARPLTIGSGARRAAESSLTVRTSTLAEVEQMELLLADDAVLFLNIPSTLGIGVASQHVSIGDVAEARPSSIGDDPIRSWTLPYLTVDAPLGGTGFVDDGGTGTPGNRSMADLAVELTTALGRPATMEDAASVYATMADASAGG